MNQLYTVINDILEENRHKLTFQVFCEALDEIINIICTPIAEELKMSYEDVENHLLKAKFKIRKILEEKGKDNAN